MGFRIESTHLDEIVVIAPEVIEDERGFFLETYRADIFRSLGLPQAFVQDNHSRSKKGVIRGLHFQWDPPMGKLMRVSVGSAFLVSVDIRRGSPTLGKWFGLEVSAENKKLVWAPPGFARGLCVLSDYAEVQYKCTALYSRQGESGIRFDDPEIGIQWPKVGEHTLSERDRNAQSLAQWLASPQSEALKYQSGPKVLPKPGELSSRSPEL
ncbi:MAG: dTDP-4-dehydrorhamnose 3,5-epimerase [Terriglobia bacterium]